MDEGIIGGVQRLYVNEDLVVISVDVRDQVLGDLPRLRRVDRFNLNDQ